MQYIKLALALTLLLFADELKLVVLLQYQNVFAPLIKLEADYDKVCTNFLECLFLFVLLFSSSF